MTKNTSVGISLAAGETYTYEAQPSLKDTRCVWFIAVPGLMPSFFMRSVGLFLIRAADKIPMATMARQSGSITASEEVTEESSKQN